MDKLDSLKYNDDMIKSTFIQATANVSFDVNITEMASHERCCEQHEGFSAGITFRICKYFGM